MNKKITGIIAVRKGSKRVPNKNIRPFADTNLLEIKVRQLLRSSSIEEVIVSSDCEEMISIANSLGATGIIRDKHFATDHVPMNEVYRHLAEKGSCDHILYAHVTSPLLTDQSLEGCILEYNNLDIEKYDSLATVSTLREYMWTPSGPLNYDPDKHPRSQDLPLCYSLNFAVNIIPRSVMKTRSNIVGSSFFPFFLEKKEAIDVDELDDFEIAEALYRKSSRT